MLILFYILTIYTLVKCGVLATYLFYLIQALCLFCLTLMLYNNIYSIHASQLLYITYIFV